MENIDQEFNNYWQHNSFLQIEDFEYDSWPLEEAISGSYDSSSPDGAASSPASKNIVSERNRRQKLNQRLFALRSVVPNITKMDKASIIKDAISYIQGLQYEEAKLEAEIRELESTPKGSLSFSKDFDRDLLVPDSSKKMKQLDSGSSRSLIEVIELKVTSMGDKVMVVNVTCNKRTDTMVKLSEVFESLNLKILTSNLNSFSGMIFNTLFIEGIVNFSRKSKRSIEQQQQQEQTQQTQFLAVKVELEQLVISILDDPSVNRVMREAGFNSTAVKNCVQECSVSSVFYGGSVVGVFSSPTSPDQQHHHHYQNPKDFNFLNHNVALWQTHFLNQSPDQNPLLASSSHHQRQRQNDLKLVVDVLLRKKTKKKNPVIVGDSVLFTEGFVSELMGRLERGENDQTGDLKQTHVVKFQFSPMTSKFMRREDVETNINELRKSVASLTTSGKNVIIFIGDLKWTINEVNNNDVIHEISPLDHLVQEMGKLIADYDDELDDVNDHSNGCKRRVWVMGTASFQTYMRCQMRQPSLETLWALHPVSVPSSANLGLSLHATSGHEARNMSNVTVTKPFSGYNKAEDGETINSVLSCCPDCVTSFEREAKAFNQEKLLPSWLQCHDEDKSPHKDDLMVLRRKWNRFCENLHNKTGQTCLMGTNYSLDLPYVSSTLSLTPNQKATNSISKFRRQDSCTIEFDLGGPINEADDDSENVKTTLGLGRSLFRSDAVTETRNKISALVKALEESVPWQAATMRLMAESLKDCVVDKKDAWIVIEGSDAAAKRIIARTVSESVFGTFDSLVHIDFKKRDSESKARKLENRNQVVFLIEDIGLADSRILKLLADRFEENRRIKTGIDQRHAIFILTKDDNGKNRDSVLQIGLEVTRQSLGRKRKPESDLPVKDGIKKQSSFNSSHLDLNMKTEEGEISPISSDLTGEEETEISFNSFLSMIQNRFFLNRSYQPGVEKTMITSAFREVFPEVEEGGSCGVRFSVEEKLVEEIGGNSNFEKGAFESWLKEVFQTGLLTVRKGGNKDISVIRMVFEGIVDNNRYGGGVGGYMGTCLPNKVQVSKFE